MSESSGSGLQDELQGLQEETKTQKIEDARGALAALIAVTQYVDRTKKLSPGEKRNIVLK
jgi:hypothetical protein